MLSHIGSKVFDFCKSFVNLFTYSVDGKLTFDLVSAQPELSYYFAGVK
jgi:hypothetical protein